MTTDVHEALLGGPRQRQDPLPASRSARSATAARATACFVAELPRPRRAARPAGKRKVKLARGHTGYFQPLPLRRLVRVARASSGCRTACSTTLEAKLGTKKTERKLLTRLANSAIGSGSR